MKFLDKLKRISKVISTHMDAISQITTGINTGSSSSIFKKLGINSGLSNLIDYAINFGKSKFSSSQSSTSSPSSPKSTNSDNEVFNETVKLKAKQSMDSLAQKMKSTILTSIIQSTLHPQSKDSSNYALKQELKHHINSMKQDWTRISRTEVWDTKLHSEADHIVKHSPTGKSDDVYVCKKTQPNACAACKRLYLESDLITPKIFKLSDLMKNGTNYGKKVDDWLPVLGCIHPNCQCELEVVSKPN